jgi:IS30 family transposase
VKKRFRAGALQRNAKRNGKQLGRRRAVFNREKARQMHMAGASVREIATALQVGKGTIQRFLAQKPTAPATI